MYEIIPLIFLGKFCDMVGSVNAIFGKVNWDTLRLFEIFADFVGDGAIFYELLGGFYGQVKFLQDMLIALNFKAMQVWLQVEQEVPEANIGGFFKLYA